MVSAERVRGIFTWRKVTENVLQSRTNNVGSIYKLFGKRRISEMIITYFYMLYVLKIEN